MSAFAMTHVTAFVVEFFSNVNGGRHAILARKATYNWSRIGHFQQYRDKRSYKNHAILRNSLRIRLLARSPLRGAQTSASLQRRGGRHLGKAVLHIIKAVGETSSRWFATILASRVRHQPWIRFQYSSFEWLYPSRYASSSDREQSQDYQGLRDCSSHGGNTGNRYRNRSRKGPAHVWFGSRYGNVGSRVSLSRHPRQYH